MLRSRLKMYSILVVLHLLVGASLIPNLPLDALGRGLACLYLLLSCVLVPVGFRAPRLQARWLGWVGLLAMGVFSSLAVLALLRAVALAVPLLMGADVGRLAEVSAQGVVLAVVVVSLVGLLNARRVARVKDVELPIAGLAPPLQGFTIVQLSDIHVGPTIRKGYIEAMVRRVNALGADLVVITGDLVDGSVEQLAAHIAPLAGLKSRYGVFVVTGNHEYYAGAHAWIAALRQLGLRVLLNEHEVIGQDGAALVLAGVTDYSAHLFDPRHRSDPAAAIRGAPAGLPRILLAHQPRSAPAALDAGFDVQISGHTHGGQFWPWMHFVRFQQPWVAGLHRLEGLQVYISRGTGYWGPPLRFGAPSEIARLRLVSAP